MFFPKDEPSSDIWIEAILSYITQENSMIFCLAPSSVRLLSDVLFLWRVVFCVQNNRLFASSQISTLRLPGGYQGECFLRFFHSVIAVPTRKALTSLLHPLCIHSPPSAAVSSVTNMKWTLGFHLSETSSCIFVDFVAVFYFVRLCEASVDVKHLLTADPCSSGVNVDRY